MFLDSPRFPDELAYGVRGGPQFSTSVVGTYDGTETRNQNWSQPLARYEVGLVHRGRDLTEMLFAFFRTIAQGRTNGFRFRDPLPGEAVGVMEPLGTGDGIRQTFPLQKRYASGSQSAMRLITKPVAGSVLAFVGGVSQAMGAYSVDHTRGLLTLTPPPGAGVLVQASFTFDVPVRFDTDQLRMQRVRPNLWSWESILLIETRNSL